MPESKAPNIMCNVMAYCNFLILLFKNLINGLTIVICIKAKISKFEFNQIDLIKQIDFNQIDLTTTVWFRTKTN